MRLRFLASLLVVSAAFAVAAQACSATSQSRTFDNEGGSSSQTSTSGSTSSSSGGDILFDAGGEGGLCGPTCSPDFHSVLDCNGNVVETCSGENGCDASLGLCANACQAAVNNKQSVGCEYYATFMDQFNPDACFAVFIANTWNSPAHLSVEFQGNTLPISQFARIPVGSGPQLTYQPFDEAAGMAPGELVVLFLSGPQGAPMPGNAPCPVTSAVPSGVLMFGQTGIGNSFRIQSDVPVVAYEINPFGGGSAAVTGASLLLPTSVWGTNYVAVNASSFDIANPSLNIIAMDDNTKVTMVPVADVSGGGGVPSGPAGQPLTINLNRGQHAQISQQNELTGSIIESDKPIGFMAGQQCMRAPKGVAYCDHGEQMIPPVQALGSEYVGVQHRPRMNEEGIWRVVGAVDGTTLTWTPDVGGPTALKAGESVEFITASPFVVKSQDTDHPFMLFAYMSGSTWKPGMNGYGDADFVISVPPQQYLSNYVFFADPTYPETNLVIVRSKLNDQFYDVELDCAGVIGGFQPIGDYEWARVDLITGVFQNVGNCSTGRREMSSKAPFGLWVWGWGSPLTEAAIKVFTANVSYGYPGGMNVRPINQVVIPPNPK